MVSKHVAALSDPIALTIFTVLRKHGAVKTDAQQRPPYYLLTD